MELLDFLEQNSVPFKLNENLSQITSFKIGGKAKVVAYPQNLPSVIKLLKFVKNNHIKFYCLGRGTNMLCLDEGFNGLIIKLSEFKDYKIENNSIYASSGLSLFRLNTLALENGLSGLEFSYGIPGSVGGAVIMNAGAFNKSVGDIIDYVKIFDGEKIRTIKRENLRFEYRKSSLDMEKQIVLGASFRLKKQDKSKIKALMQQNFEHRKNTQPYSMPSAGSVFKRLDGSRPVSKLIDECKLKGTRMGDAEISNIHAGFVVNMGKATCKDVLNLIQYVLERLKNSYGVIPQLEIKILGDKNGITW